MRYAYQNHFVDGNGSVVTSGTVNVYLTGTSTIATIYAAESGGSPISGGEITTGSTDGSFKFWVDTNDYDTSHNFRVVLSKTNFQTKTYDDLVLFPNDDTSVLTIDDLRLLTGGFKSVQVLGYYAEGDGGGGPIRIWDAASTATDNGGSVIKPTAIAAGSPGRWVWEWSGPLNVRWFGAKGDGVTNDAAAIQAWMDYAFGENGLGLYVPAGQYVFTSNIVPQINGTTSRTFTIKGDGMEVSRFITSNASSIKIFADTPPARANAFVSLVLDGVSIENTSGSKTGIGLDIYSMQRCVVDNTRITGFNYGCKIRSSWNNSIGKRNQWVENNVGLKVPRTGSGADLNEGFNAIHIAGMSLANNVKAGASIAAGNVITITDVLVESSPVAIYLVEALKSVKINQLSYEAGSVTLTETNKDGTDASYLIITGKDEDGNVGDTSLPVRQLVIGPCLTNSGQGKLWLENVNGVDINGWEPSESLIRLGDNVKNVRSNGLGTDDRFTDAIIPGIGRNTANGIHRNYSRNFVINGDFNAPGLPYITYTGGAASGAISTQNLDDTKPTRVLDITLPGGQTSVTAQWLVAVPSGAEYATTNRLLQAALHAKGSSADIASVSLSVLDQNAVRATKAVTTGLTGWFTAHTQMAVNVVVSPVTVLGVKITVARTTGTGDAHLYVDQILLGDTNYNAIEMDGGPAAFGGYHTTVTTSTDLGSGTLRYTGVADVGMISANYFEVIASPRRTGDVSFNFATLKGTGGDAGKVTVYCTAQSMVFDLLIIPKITRLP